MIIKVFNIPNNWRFIHSGLMTSLLSYPIKYSKNFFVPYSSFLDTNVLLPSVLSILNVLLFL